MYNKWKRQQGLYLPVEMLAEMQSVAARLDRSVSWVVQLAWKLSRADLARFPGVDTLPRQDPRGSRA